MNYNEKIKLLSLAYDYASKYSTDKSTQNGAIIIDENNLYDKDGNFNILMFGCNHFPDGVIESPERWERPLKYSFVEHAERDVIYKCSKNGIKTDKLTMVVCWASCADCARAIIESGIKNVIAHKLPEHDNPQWKESINIGDQMFKESGVNIDRIEGEIGISVLFSGKLTKR